MTQHCMLMKSSGNKYRNFFILNSPDRKGSYNKPKNKEMDDTVESIHERIVEAEAAIETLANDLKSKKAELSS